MHKIFQFGEKIEGYATTVLNEREIRAAAGMHFLIMLVSVMWVVLNEDFLFIKYSITVFLADFFIRVLINPKFSPTLIIGRLLVAGQEPEYVGAGPKKFAWTVGLVLAAIFFTLLVAINSYSPVTGVICLVCLVLLFCETAFGICLGCKFHSYFNKEKAQYCPVRACAGGSPKSRRKISPLEVSILIGFCVAIFMALYQFNEFYRLKPYDLFGL